MSCKKCQHGAGRAAAVLLTMQPSNRLASVIIRSSVCFPDSFSRSSFVVRPVWEEMVTGALPLPSREFVKVGTQANQAELDHLKNLSVSADAEPFS